METELEDMALRSAISQNLRTQPPLRLPSNFAYQTMQRIHRERQLAERRERRIAIAITVAVSLLGVLAISWLYGSLLLSLLEQYSWTILPTTFCLLFLFALDTILRRKFNHKLDIQI